MGRRSGAQRRAIKRDIKQWNGRAPTDQTPAAARIRFEQPPTPPAPLEAQPPILAPARPSPDAGMDALLRRVAPPPPLPDSLIPTPLPERPRDAHPAYGLTTGQWLLLELSRESMRTAHPDFPAVHQTLSDLTDLEQLARRILEFRS